MKLHAKLVELTPGTNSDILLRIGQPTRGVWPFSLTSISTTRRWIHCKPNSTSVQESQEGEWVYFLEGEITFLEMRQRSFKGGELAYLPKGMSLDYTVHAPVLTCSLLETSFELLPGLNCADERGLARSIRRTISGAFPNLRKGNDIQNAFGWLFWAYAELRSGVLSI
jgi:uncharacterized cupin superfamily protein